MNRVINLTEGQTTYIPSCELDESVALTLHRGFKDKVKLEFPSVINNQSYVVTPGHYIGQIPIDQVTTIRICPKVQVSSIFRMLEYAYNLKSFSLLEGRVPSEAIVDIFVRLAQILARMVSSRARCGLYQGYIQKQENLAYLKGRPLIRESMVKGLGTRVELDCEYEENTVDLDENQILAWTLFIIPKLYPMNDDIRREVRQAYNALYGAVRLRPVTADECIGRFYQHLNYDYQPMHSICRFFLEHTGPGLSAGEHEFLPFLVNMPNLFQTFVSEWLRRNAPPGILFKPNHSFVIDSTGVFNFKIDIVMTDSEGKVLAVLDTKYKHNDRPDSSDIHQMISYCTMMGTKNAFLIYPEEGRRHQLSISKAVDIFTVGFDIRTDPDVAGKKMLDYIISNS